jgi:hypothetical protein
MTQRNPQSKTRTQDMTDIRKYNCTNTVLECHIHDTAPPNRARSELQHGPDRAESQLLSVLYGASPTLEPHLDADGAGLIPAQQLLRVRREVVEGRVARPAEVVPIVRLVRRAPG